MTLYRQKVLVLQGVLLEHFLVVGTDLPLL